MLTRKQLELLDFIRVRMESDGVPPSFDEMKEALDLRSKSGIHRLITALEERGFIRRLAHRARAIEIVKLPEAMERPGFTPRVIAGDRPEAPPPRGARPVEAIHALELPVMGRIAAGVPIEAISEVSHHVAVPGSMLSGSVAAWMGNGSSMPFWASTSHSCAATPRSAKEAGVSATESRAGVVWRRGDAMCGFSVC